MSFALIGLGLFGALGIIMVTVKESHKLFRYIKNLYSYEVPIKEGRRRK